MSEIIDEASLADQLAPIRQFRKNGFPVKMAMQNDVNGAGWCLVDYFSQIGIKYLVMGEHGHRALIPFDKPTVFWWESPASERGGRQVRFHKIQGSNGRSRQCQY